MYSHTRACSIQKRVHDLGYTHTGAVAVPETDQMPEGLVQLLRTLAVRDDCLEKVVREHRPHLFAEYLLLLANAFNGFYRDCHITEGTEVNAFYFAVSELAREAMKSGMEALGIQPLETM